MLIVHFGENDLPHASAAVNQLDPGRLAAHGRDPSHCANGVGQTAPTESLERGDQAKALDNSRKKSNRKLQKVIQLNGEGVLAQPRICFDLPHLFRGDGVHLSPEGCDINLFGQFD